MIQSETIKELLAIYENAKKSYENEKNKERKFYTFLCNELLNKTKQVEDRDEVLCQYEMSCQSYFDSNITEFNICVAAFIISIISLSDVNLNSSCAVLFLLGIIFLVAIWSIRGHIKSRKISEILYAIEKIK